jgi:4-hydroxybenzoate-CoA ligase
MSEGLPRPEANAADWFVDRHVREGRGESRVFTDPWRSLTYAELARGSGAVAAGLARLGIAREQRIALFLRDSCAFPLAFWGALKAGVVPVPLNTLLPPPQLAALHAASRARRVIAAPALAAPLAAARASLPSPPPVLFAEEEASPPPGDAPLAWRELISGEAAETAAVSPDEVAFWLYSSGSTGRPKGVLHVHASLRATYETYGRQVLGIEPDDLVFSAAKLFFAYGLGNAMTFPMAVGAGSVLLPERPTPEAVLATLARYQPTLFAGVPTLYAALLAHPGLGAGAGSPRLRRAISAGEPLPEAIGLAWRARVGVDILDGLGSTEMLHIFLSNRPGEVRYGTTGRPVPGYEVKILDAAGRELGPGEPGELWVKGPSAASGYWNRRAESRAVFVGEWSRTGDVYEQDAEGFYRYHGRADDLFKVSGIWVSPFEVEAALLEHPAVLEAAVVGRPDAGGLLKPHAFIVLREGVKPEPALFAALKAHVKERAGPWKYPRVIHLVTALPKTATGKIQRFRLRAGEVEAVLTEAE